MAADLRGYGSKADIERLSVGTVFLGLTTKPELRENKTKKLLFPATASVECLVPVVSA
jgi:hypothetical protein